MNPITFAGEAFSEYFCTRLLWEEGRLRERLDPQGAAGTLRRASSALRHARRELRDRRQATSTRTLLLNPLAEILGWRLGPEEKVETAEGTEEAGAPLLDGDGRMLARVRVVAPDAHLDLAPSGLHRRYAPHQSLVRVLEEQGLSWGILANAHELRLVRRAEGFIASHIALSLVDLADSSPAAPDIWRLVWGLLRHDAWTPPPVPDQVVILSREHQARVGTGLGRQVQAAVEALLRGVVNHPANRDRLPELAPEVLRDLYAQSLRLLYRLLFVLYAEARNLLPVDLPTYRDGYSLARLAGLATDPRTDPRRAGESGFLEASLRALFAMLGRRTPTPLGTEGIIPSYAGGLFAPLRHPDEATDLEALAWGDSTLAEVLERLTRVPGRRGGELRVSYRELDVEQLGSIYETLLALTPVMAAEDQWRAVVDGRDVVLTTAQRADLARRRGEADETTGVVEDAGAEEDEWEEEAEDEEGGAGDQGEDEEAEADEESEADEDEDAGVEREEGEAPAPRSGKPVRILAAIPCGTVFLRPAMGRKQTGSYYTNRAVVEFLVRRTIDPLAEGKTPEGILRLGVVDPAMGSGHFLVGACRRLAEHLRDAYRKQVEDYQRRFPETPALLLLEEAGIPPEVARAWDRSDEEVLAACRLLVAAHCLYGVDKNPLAVELAKVSLWLATAAQGHPLTFLDHRLRCGDSLLGLPADDVVRPVPPRTGRNRGRRVGRSRGDGTAQQVMEDLFVPAQRQMRERLRRALACIGVLTQRVGDDPGDLEAHRLEFEALLGTIEPLWKLHQMRIGRRFLPEEHPAADVTHVDRWLDEFGRMGYISEQTAAPAEEARRKGETLGAFCWPLAFPEVFCDPDGSWKADGGFDAVLTNPPWEKVKPDRKEFHAAYDPAIRDFQGRSLAQRIRELHRLNGIAEAWQAYEAEQKVLAGTLLGFFRHQVVTVNGRRTGGDPDLFKFFVERSHQILRPGGAAGLVVPSGLHSSQGATGLRRLLLDESRVQVLCKFDNERKVFPGTDHRFKFDLVVFRKGGPSGEFPAIFLSWETEEALERMERHPGLVRLTPDLIRTVSPDTLTIPEYRSERDIEIVRKMHAHCEPFGVVMQRWGLQFRTELHMTNDSHLFRDRAWLRRYDCTQLPGERWRAADEAVYAAGPYIRRGDGWVRVEDQDDPDAAVVYAGEEYLPLMEGKWIHQFDHCAFAYVSGEGKSQVVTRPLSLDEKQVVPHFFVSRRESASKIGGQRDHKLGFRAIAHQSVERTAFAAYVPGIVPVGHSMWVVTCGGNLAGLLWWAAIANSFAFDYRIRMGLSGGNASLFTLLPVPVPDFSTNARIAHDIIVAVCQLSCFVPETAALWNAIAPHYPDAMPYPWSSEYTAIDPRARAQLRARLDALVADLYGLSLEDYAYILSTFFLLDRSQPALPGDRFIRPRRGGRMQDEPRSYITRDLALLTYCEHKGVEPPADVVEFFARAGVDIEQITGPVRDLRARVERATTMGAVAYVPTPIGRYVERATSVMTTDNR
jgi:hypothetical protein